MTNKPIIEAEKNLANLRSKTDIQIWQYAILKEFVDLFSQNNRVLNFISTNYGTLSYGLIDDSVLLSKDELALYEKGKEKSLEEKLFELLEMSKTLK